jgi:DNA transformation protein and related proteins
MDGDCGCTGNALANWRGERRRRLLRGDTMNIDGLRDHCLELLASVGRPRARRMFGGHGIYVDELFVAIIANEQLFLKADARTAPRFEAAGCAAFCYDAKGRSVSLGYWSAPEEAMDSPEGMRPWAMLAMEAALRARADSGGTTLNAKRKGSRTVRPRGGAQQAPPTPAATASRRKG